LDDADVPYFTQTGATSAPGSTGAGQAPYDVAVPDQVTEFRALLAVEAGRLRDAAHLPPADRRDLLDDLVTRLAVLLETVPGRFPQVRALVELLHGTASLEEKWAKALQVLTEDGGDTAPSSDDADGGRDARPGSEAGTASAGDRRTPPTSNPGTAPAGERGKAPAGGSSGSAGSGNTPPTGTGEPPSRGPGEVPFWKR
jgi:hypothetical protein